MNKKPTDLLLNLIKEKISKSPLLSRFLDADLEDLDFFPTDEIHLQREDLQDANIERLYKWLYDVNRWYYEPHVVKYVLKCRIKEDDLYKDRLWDEWKIKGKTAADFWDEHIDEIYNYVNILYMQSSNLENLDSILENEKI